MKHLFRLTFIFLFFCSCAVSKAKPSEAGTIALLGDSMTWIGGDSCEKPEGWSHYLKEQFPKSEIDVYARSGATWTNAVGTKGDPEAYSKVIDDENVIYNQVSRLIYSAEKDPGKRPDLIIIYAGANDAWFEKKRPGIYGSKTVPEDISKCRPSDFTTLVSSIELGVRRLQQAFPEALIVLVSPIEMAQTTPERIARVGDTIEKTGERLGVEVLRADRNVPVRHSEEKQKRRYTSDGAHTNPQGARLIADYIINAIFED